MQFFLRALCRPCLPTLPDVPPQAKNGLENYAYSVKNTLNDPAVGGKLDAGDKEKLTKVVDETIDWLDHNQVGFPGGQRGPARRVPV